MSDTDNYKTLEKYVKPIYPMEQEINHLDKRISSVEMNLCRMISALERKMEERTLILECIEERYDDYC